MKTYNAEKILNEYEQLVLRAEKATNIYDVIKIAMWSPTEVIIYGLNFDGSKTNQIIPLKWLYLSDEDLGQEKERILANERKKQKQEEKDKKKYEEQKEREEYERLKKKYGEA